MWLDYTLALARELLRARRSCPLREVPRRPCNQALAAFKPRSGSIERWVREVAADLRAHAGKGIIVAGRRQPPLVHALAFALNAALGNLGKTIELRKPPAETGVGIDRGACPGDRQGQVETLIILGGNPAYNAPADLGFADRLETVANTIRLGLHVDETSRLASWHLPPAHHLEAWGDARAGDGTLLPIQPLIEPLFGGRNVLEEVARLVKFETTSPYEIVRRSFRKISGVAEAGFEAAWRKFLHEGTFPAGAYATSATRRAVGRGGPGRRGGQAWPGSALGDEPRAGAGRAMPRSTMAGSPTTAGSRSFPIRSPS